MNNFSSGLTDFVVPVVTLPDLSVVAVPTEPNLVTAGASINLNAYDLDAGQAVNVGCRTRIRYYGGLRYSRISDGFDVIYNYSGVNPTPVVIPSANTQSSITVNLGADLTEVIKRKSQFKGIGPHLGVDFNHYLNWGFGLVGGISTSLLVGHTDANVNQAFTRTGTAITIASTEQSIPVNTRFSTTTIETTQFDVDDHSQIAPNFDAKLGLDFTYQECNPTHTKVTVEAGYMVSHYFNVVVHRLNVVDAHFEGLYAGIQVKI